jgi:tetratricopeptide (TPR) repeat protein
MLSILVVGICLLIPSEQIKRVHPGIPIGLIYLPLLFSLPALLRGTPGAHLSVWFVSFLLLFFITVPWKRHIGWLQTPKITTNSVEAARQQSVTAFLASDLEEARKIAETALAGPIDLEEGRQLRAWLAYLELAAGRPVQAAALAEAAIGPQVMAGEEWLAYCRTLHAWALWEAGYAADAATEARFYYTNTPNAGPIRQSARALALYLQEAQSAEGTVEENPAPASSPCDAWDLGLRARRLARVEERGLAHETAQRAESAATTPFARARALLDHADVLLALGQPDKARSLLRESLELWPTLPAALAALAAAEETLGSPERAAAVRADLRQRFPEYDIANHAAASGTPP